MAVSRFLNSTKKPRNLANFPHYRAGVYRFGLTAPSKKTVPKLIEMTIEVVSESAGDSL